jgi:hypothetical protein
MRSGSQAWPRTIGAVSASNSAAPHINQINLLNLFNLVACTNEL